VAPPVIVEVCVNLGGAGLQRLAVKKQRVPVRDRKAGERVPEIV